MFKPLFNKVLVELDDKDAKWGKGSDDNIGGEVYREGKLTEVGTIFSTNDHPIMVGEMTKILKDLVGKAIMWHEGHEAGTVFEEDGKKYALIFWWDIAGVKDAE
jgi:hypothetical protein